MPLSLRPIDRILSSRGNVRLLRALHATGAASGRRAAAAAGLPAKTAWRALQSLVETQVVHREELSGQHLFRVNREHHLWPSIEKLFAEEDGLVEALFAHLRELLGAGEKGSPVVSMVTYGGSTRRGWSASSEMEILVLADADEATDPIRQKIAATAPSIRRRFGVRLSTVVLTASRFEERRRGGDPYAMEVLSDAILISGRDPRDLVGEGRAAPR